MDDQSGDATLPRILLVDDDATQLKLGRIRLAAAGFDVETASGAYEALEKAKLRPPDAIVSDVLMGDLDGFGLCRLVRNEPSLARIPVILLSAHYHDEPDQALAAGVGASALIERTPDFDTELAVLRRSLEAGRQSSSAAPDDTLWEQHLRSNAHQLTRLLSQARSAEERYRTLFDNAKDLISVLSVDGIVLEVNQRSREFMGLAPEDMIGKHIKDFAPDGRKVENTEAYQESLSDGSSGRVHAVPIERPDGSTVYVDFSVTVVEIDGKPLVLSIGHDVTETVLAARSIAAAEEKYRSLVERIPDVIWTARDDGSLTFVTPNAKTVFGYTAEELCAETKAERSARVHPDDIGMLDDAFSRLGQDGAPFDVEYRRRRPDGQWVWLRNRATALYERNGKRSIEGMVTDVTERRRLEDTLRQAQKMEAIGQLTGGIAHDFNNILGAILANSYFLIEDIAEHDPRREDALEIKAAAERAAALTRQLLAFSRRQVLEPTTVELNSAVTAIERMLQRLIGEDIDFTLNLAPDAGLVRVDLGQLEQVILNLVVNARDAMPTGGDLVIETCNVDLDEALSAIHGTVSPGRYVMLSVTDSGSGMDEPTKQRIFEPFFTTKEPGKGTGLGLSTCYGIVQQSGGYIWVYSELGRGSVFKIYLPRVDGLAEQVRRGSGRRVQGGSETILLIEDDARLRTAITRMLQTRGYRVLVAANGNEAVEMSTRHEGTIHLVLSDVIMPGGSGPEVVERLQQQRTGLRALFMSGYTDHAVLQRGAIGAGMNFLQKPFVPEALAKKVREVLDA